MNVPQCICIVDSGGHPLTMGRMDGAFALSIKTALRKAQTAAYGIPTGGIAPALELKLAIGTDGKRINLLGGLPVIIDGHVTGAIGVGSGTGEQDREVAAAALGASRAPSASRSDVTPADALLERETGYIFCKCPHCGRKIGFLARSHNFVIPAAGTELRRRRCIRTPSVPLTQPRPVSRQAVLRPSRGGAVCSNNARPSRKRRRARCVRAK